MSEGCSIVHDPLYDCNFRKGNLDLIFATCSFNSIIFVDAVWLVISELFTYKKNAYRYIPPRLHHPSVVKTRTLDLMTLYLDSLRFTT